MLKSEEVIEFLRDSLAESLRIKTVLTLQIEDTVDCPLDPKPIGIRIFAESGEQKTNGLLLLHPDREFDESVKNWIKYQALQLVYALVEIINQKQAEKTVSTFASKAKYN